MHKTINSAICLAFYGLLVSCASKTPFLFDTVFLNNDGKSGPLASSDICNETETCVVFRGETFEFPTDCKDVLSGNFPNGTAQIVQVGKDGGVHTPPGTRGVALFHPKSTDIMFGYRIYPSDIGGVLISYSVSTQGEFDIDDPYLGQTRHDSYSLNGVPPIECSFGAK